MLKPKKFLLGLFGVFFLVCSCLKAEHVPNGNYTGRNLDRVAFPIGGTGAGMFCLEGTGAISHVSVRNQMEFFNEPSCFAGICVLGSDPDSNICRVIEGPVPDWKFFGRGGSGTGSGGSTYGFPRFKTCEFNARFPFAEISLNDSSLPLDAEICGWSPFTPGDGDSSSYPIGAIEYTFKNRSDANQKCVFSFSTRNFLGNEGSTGSIENGFVLYAQRGEKRDTKGAFVVVLKDESGVVVDHCWFRGGWWDALTIAWDNVQKGRMIDNPPVEQGSPGVTLSLPFELKPGESKTVKMLCAWYYPETNMVYSSRRGSGTGDAFEGGPSKSGEKVQGQQPISGYLGNRFVNSFDPTGDSRTGTLVSQEIELDRKYVHFLIGGGRSCSFELHVDGKMIRTASGKDDERLEWASWDVDEFAGKKAVLKIVDNRTDGWGHINIDHIVSGDLDIEALKIGRGNEILNDPAKVVLIDDFERDTFAPWKTIEKQKIEPKEDEPVVPEFYIPWYATKFGKIEEVVNLWLGRYEELRKRSVLFTETFYDTTLPPEVIEAVAANLSIMKSPTVLRQHDGRLWCWEGCNDHGGSCNGTCTHVWNYAQSFCHIFPELERSLRQTEFNEGLDENGRQAFRVNLPISPGGTAFDASDGQLGSIIRVYREWKILGNDDWIREYWPKLRLSFDYMIKKYDPRHTGLLEEDHHNTYDINYFGPDGHCGSFYLAALGMMCEIGDYLKDDVSLYKELLEKGKKRMVQELFNDEYFVQIVMKEGLNHNFGKINPNDQSLGYREIAKTVNEQGPKYQYGNGCLSDGVLGFWMAKTAGFDTEILPDEMVRSHLLAVFKYNFKEDLSEHANPQRPSYAIGNDGGLLLCTWPRGGKPFLPFVYSDEVWTGIEYQVASHLMMLGCVDEGLAIVKTLRKRHDGVRRNPFNEYECGHFYARAMASYALLQGLTGVRYDARSKTLYVDSKIGDFRSFLSTETGFGTVEYKDGKVTVEVKCGKIPVEKIVDNTTTSERDA